MRAGVLVKEARLRAGITQSELATRLGTKQPVVARWEAGLDEPTFPSLQKTLKACGLDLQVSLVEHDDHDSGLIAQQLAMTPDERMRNFENMVAFAEQAARARKVGK